MGLNSALLIGRSAILSSQAAMNIAGNNMANAATPGYHRQIGMLSPGRSAAIGRNQFVGTGVNLVSVHRAVDIALQARLREAISDENSALVDYQFLSSIETLQNELTSDDLSSRLSAFFNTFSELANNPTDHAMRSVVLQQGSSLAGHISTLRDDYGAIRAEVDRSLGVSIEQANGVLTQIATLNAEIAQVEGGSGGEASSLRDQRDQLIDEVSQYFEVTTIEQANGAMDILVNSVPVVLGGESRGMELRTVNGPNGSEVSVRVGADGTMLAIDSGSVGALMRQREETVDPAIAAIDEFTAQLIFQVNNLHAQGTGSSGRSIIEGLMGVSDSSANLNADAAGVPWTMSNGTFQLHVISAESGDRVTYQVAVDPDTMSLDELVAQINTTLGVENVTATVTADGGFRLEAASGFTIAFSEDDTGVLASLGMNAFFGGHDAGSIAVDQTLLDDPSLLSISDDFTEGGNGIALSMVALQDEALEELNGGSLREFWQAKVSDHAVRTQTAGTRLESNRLVRGSIDAQNQAVSGVSIDEEAIDLMTLQRQFQAAARFITVIDETMDTLLSIV